MKDYGRRFSIKLLENCENVKKCLDLFIYLFGQVACEVAGQVTGVMCPETSRL